jgi:spermidine synthase
MPNLLTGKKILEEVDSPVNGKIRVVRSLGFGTYLQVDNLTQSGGVVYEIWKKTIKKIERQKSEIKNCLILGLGGGSVAKLVREYWPKAKITGVDIDPMIVELGTRHLGLDKKKVKIVIGDASDFVQKTKDKYDLILIDTYLGYDYPSQFESGSFLRQVLDLLNRNGLAVFNRLYFDDKRSAAVKFGKKLEKVFSIVEYFYPQANLMIICKA